MGGDPLVPPAPHPLTELMVFRKTPKVMCHVFESDEASLCNQFSRSSFAGCLCGVQLANGIDDPSYLRQIEYQKVLNSQGLLGDELEMFVRKETQECGCS